MNRPNSRQETHEQLISNTIDAIWARTEREVNAVIPSTISKDRRKAILEELLPNTRFVLESLGIEQLQDERAIGQLVTNTVSTAQYFVRRILKGTESVCPDCNGTGSFDLFEHLSCERCVGTGIAVA